MFTPIHSLLGGSLLFLASQQYSLLLGRTFGCSSILSGPVLNFKGSWASLQAQALSGLLLGAVLMQTYGTHLLVPAQAPQSANLHGRETGTAILYTYAALAGSLVGFGTRLANGCTSGHMLSGLARLSKRSAVATLCFFTSAVLCVRVVGTGPLYPSSAPAYRVSPHDAHHVRQLGVVVVALFTSSALLASLAYRSRRRATWRSITALSAGVNFAAGLLISGMSRPEKTLGFLNLTHTTSFDPSLFMIVLGGLLPNFCLHQFLGSKTPILDTQSHLSNNNKIDAKLVIGSLLFGVGWGLYGICPGPAIVGLATPTKELVSFVIASLVGSKLASVF